MQDKIILRTGDFVPTLLPTIEGRLALEQLSPATFPAYAYPVYNGIDLVIRSGYPMLLTPPFIILNQDFRTKFKHFFKRVSDLKITVHATVSSRTSSNLELLELLAHHVNGLPIDIKLNLGFSVYENASAVMHGKNCVGLTQGLFGNEHTFMKHVEAPHFQLVKTKSHLEELLSFLFENDSNLRGMGVVAKEGEYKEGRVPVAETDMAIIRPISEEKGRILYVNCLSRKTYENKVGNIADSMIVSLGTKNHEFDLRGLPISVREHIANNVERIAGKQAIFEAMHLPGWSHPKLINLIKVFL